MSDETGDSYTICSWCSVSLDDHTNLGMRRCCSLLLSSEYKAGYDEGSAVAFGIIGMAEAIRANRAFIPDKRVLSALKHIDEADEILEVELFQPKDDPNGELTNSERARLALHWAVEDLQAIRRKATE